MADTNETTLRPGGRSSDSPASRVVVLTLLCHPDLRRVGERAVLWPASDRSLLSRQAPEFAHPGAVWDSRPLDDPYLSRKPWTFTRDDGGVLITRGGSSMELTLDGEAVTDSVRVAAQSLGRGVVLQLADRILLLLHSSVDFGPGSAVPSSSMVGASEAWGEVVAAIGRVADLNVPVLLRGESGTGKELAARAIHEQSTRCGKPFVAVNLGALPTSLAGSELFGHVKGAFTGASSARQGYFSAADGGTLFLDEIGEAPAEVQAMLLRALETGEIVPVGSHLPTNVDVRVVAATDSDLESRALRGDFKEPLLHRLSAYVIRLPALRDRREDIGRLVLCFARQALSELGSSAPIDHPNLSGEPWLASSVMASLMDYRWPGNVRQLKNVVRQLVIDSRGERTVRPGGRLDDLLTATSLSGSSEASAAEPAAGIPDRASMPEIPRKPSTKGRRPAEITSPELERALAEERFEPAAAARLLGISRASIYNLIRRHPTLRVAEDVPDHELESVLDAVNGKIPDAADRLGVSARALARRVKRSS